jgi:LacI family repressor for deo operon, udp, cdd, tsx, nupC, and nupG
VLEETRLAVEAVVRETGYTISHAGRGLRMQSSRQLLVLLPTISNQFFAEIVQGVDAEAQKHGYGVLVGSTEGSTAREETLARQLLSGAVDGLVILTGHIPSMLAEAEHLSRLVMVSEDGGNDTVATIGIDNVEAARQATAHLLSLGHRVVGHIAGPDGNVLTRQRLAGYRAALAEAGIDFQTKLVASGDFSVAAGSRAMAQLLSRSTPSAVFCANDDMALGAMAEARAHGLTIPDHMSIVGFDDLPYAAYVDPALTTICQPRRRFGELAVDTLIRGKLHTRTNLAFELKIRGSTKKR